MASRTTKLALGAAGALVGIAGAGVAGVLVTLPDGVEGTGAVLAELRGHTETDAFDSARDAPRDLVPGWASAGTDVVVVRPGDASGDDAGSRRARMTWPGALPDCTELTQVGMPFDGGGSWPDLGAGTAQLCDGWVTVVQDGQLYAWTDDATLAGA